MPNISLPGEQGTGRADTASERRRQSLRDFLKAHDLTPAELARRIGLRLPNAIYNFLAGRSSGLSQPMIEKILALFPDEYALDLVAPHLVKPWGRARIVRVTLHVHPEMWLAEPTLPVNAQFHVTCPGILGLSDDSLMGALVIDSDPGSLYRAGTVVICAPDWQQGRIPPLGARVLVSVHHNGEQQIAVREVVEQDGIPMLLHRSMNPATQDSVPAPWADTLKPRDDNRRAEVLGVIVAAWQPEWLPPPA